MCRRVRFKRYDVVSSNVVNGSTADVYSFSGFQPLFQHLVHATPSVAQLELAVRWLGLLLLPVEAFVTSTHVVAMQCSIHSSQHCSASSNCYRSLHCAGEKRPMWIIPQLLKRYNVLTDSVTLSTRCVHKSHWRSPLWIRVSTNSSCVVTAAVNSITKSIMLYFWLL